MANKWGTGKTCLGCGGTTSSMYGYCQTNRKCRTANELARKHAQIESERDRFKCLGCGRGVYPFQRSKATYVCTECMGLARKLNKLIRSLEPA